MENPSGVTDELRSIKADVHSPIRFANKTDGRVNLFWLNYTGGKISYRIMEIGASPLRINSFMTHPWIAVDEESKKRLWLNSQDVFYPPAPQVAHIRRGNVVGRLWKPTNVEITVPVYNAETLEESCCKVVSRTIKLETINQLPKVLKNRVQKHLERPPN